MDVRALRSIPAEVVQYFLAGHDMVRMGCNGLTSPSVQPYVPHDVSAGRWLNGVTRGYYSDTN